MLQMMSAPVSESNNAQFELMLTKTFFIAAFSLACLEIREDMRRRLILHETGFTRQRFFHFLHYRRLSIL